MENDRLVGEEGGEEEGALSIAQSLEESADWKEREATQRHKEGKKDG